MYESSGIEVPFERLRPRDLYDVIHIYRDNRWQLERKLVLDILEKNVNIKRSWFPTWH